MTYKISEEWNKNKIFTFIISGVDLEWHTQFNWQLDKPSELKLLGKKRNILAPLKVNTNFKMIVLEQYSRTYGSKNIYLHSQHIACLWASNKS